MEYTKRTWSHRREACTDSSNEPKWITVFPLRKYFIAVMPRLVDSNYKFIAAEVGAYGNNSDGSSSKLVEMLSSNTRHVSPVSTLAARSNWRRSISTVLLLNEIVFSS
jgi:hypothetical protein